TGTTSPVSVTMDGDKTVTATFAINTYSLTVNTVGQGSVAKSPDQASYDHGSTVQLTATPATGWHFAGWSGAATGTDSPVSLTMDGDKKVTATLEINTNSLTVTTVGQGSVAKSPDQASYDHCNTVQLTATPATGWHFAGWSGAATGTANPVSVTMDGNKTVTATFAINTYTITASAAANGTITPSGAVSVNHGADQSFTITPA